MHGIIIFFLSISLDIYFGCSKEPSHREGSFEYPQHMVCLRNEKKNNYALLSRGLNGSDKPVKMCSIAAHYYKVWK